MLALVPAPASAQLQLKTEDITIKFGFQGQFWADYTQDATAPSAGNQGYAQNFYLLRDRLMFGGTIGNNISFFFDTDDPKLGLSPNGTAATKTLTTANATSPGFLIQDAWVAYKVNNHLELTGGEMLVPNSRQGLQSTLSYYTVNISSVATVANTTLVESALRDVGFQARGYFFNDRFQYRGGIFDGFRTPNGRNAPRPALYLQYDFLDREKEYTYAGTALGNGTEAPVTAGHRSASEIGMQTESPQHVPIAQTDPAGQGALSQIARPPHDVLPGTHKLPPVPTVTQTQSGLLLLHGTNVSQVAPAH